MLTAEVVDSVDSFDKLAVVVDLFVSFDVLTVSITVSVDTPGIVKH